MEAVAEDVDVVADGIVEDSFPLFVVVASLLEVAVFTCHGEVEVHLRCGSFVVGVVANVDITSVICFEDVDAIFQ